MIRIIADSSCNLPNEVLQRYNVSIVPLTITIGGETYIDYEEITPEELYEKLPSLSDLPTTAAPNPEAFINLFIQESNNGVKDIIVITLSSGASATYQSAAIAKDMFLKETDNKNIRIHVVDSLCISHGSGYLIIKTGELINSGAPFEEIVDFLETYKTRVKHFLSVGDMDNLLKSGRLSHTSAIIGKMLHVEPIMTMKNGKGTICGKVRGRKKVIKYYVDEFVKRIDKEMTDFVIIGYTSDISYAQNLKDSLITETDFDGNIYVWQIGATVGTHVGLGGVSMFFIEKPKTHHYAEIYEGVKTQVKSTVSRTLNHLKK